MSEVNKKTPSHDAFNNSTTTLLNFACEIGNPQLVQSLLENGADVRGFPYTSASQDIISIIEKYRDKAYSLDNPDQYADPALKLPLHDDTTAPIIVEIV